MFELAGSVTEMLVGFALRTVMVAGLLWLAMKVVRERASFLQLAIASMIASLVGGLLGLINVFLGAIAGFVVLVFMINRFTGMDWMMAGLAVVISWVLAILAVGLFVAAVISAI